jgi:hypothetical protein
VTVPAVHGTVFGPDDFSSALGRVPPPPQVYYVSAGSLVDAAGRPVAGPLGRPNAGLASVALSRPDPTGPILAAAVQGNGTQARLLVGNLGAGVKPTELIGVLTRPAFETDRREVWIGNGTRVYRVVVSASGSKPQLRQVPILDSNNTGRVVALRMSPDGARVALVLASGQPANGELYVGAVVRDSGQVAIDGLTRISPQGLTVNDVAWLNPLRLFAVGVSQSTGDSLSYDAGVDGADWRTRVVGLSDKPDSVTVAAGASAWLSAEGFVWEQSAGQWVSPTGGQTPGTAPVYLE